MIRQDFYLSSESNFVSSLTDNDNAGEAKPVDEVEQVGSESVPEFHQVSPQLTETVCHFIFYFIIRSVILISTTGWLRN